MSKNLNNINAAMTSDGSLQNIKDENLTSVWFFTKLFLLIDRDRDYMFN